MSTFSKAHETFSIYFDTLFIIYLLSVIEDDIHYQDALKYLENKRAMNTPISSMNVNTISIPVTKNFS